MDPLITVETEMFEHREVKPHFHQSLLLRRGLCVLAERAISDLAESGFDLSNPIQEDYGWGFWVRRGKDCFWVAISYVGDGPKEVPAQWSISVNYDPGLNLIKRIFHKPDKEALQQLRDQILETVKSETAIRILPTPRTA